MSNALFALHLMGPDDIYAAPSYEAALRVANAINVEFASHAIKPYAVAVPWLKTPEEHVQSLPAWDQEFGSNAKVVPLSERRQLNKALDALDALSETWAAEVNLRAISEKLAQANDVPAAIYAMVVQGWVEGAYAGRTSHRTTASPHEIGVLAAGVEQQSVAADHVATLKEIHQHATFPHWLSLSCACDALDAAIAALTALPAAGEQPFRNMQDGATFEQYHDALAVGGLTPVDQMAFDNMLHDRFFAPPDVDAGAERVMAAVAKSIGAIKECHTIPSTYCHKPDGGDHG